jgi:membrane protein DedA with SNARE-associated domain
MHHLLETWFSWVLGGGYVGIIVLMAMGSSPLPVPAEVVIPPAAFLAAQGHLNFAGVIIAGTLGSYLGAALVYWLSLVLGRPLLLKYGRYCLLAPDKLEKAEIWLVRYETGGIFFARLIPGIRHFISIPAGIVRMRFASFSAATVAGSAAACGLLAYLGRRAYETNPDLLSDPDGLVHFIKGQSHLILIVIGVFAGLYLLGVRLTKPASK